MALKAEQIHLKESEGRVLITCGKNTLEISKDPFGLRVMDEDGRLICESNMHDVNSVGEGKDLIPPIGYSTDESGKTVSVNIGMKLHYDEHIYGLGEHFTPFDKVGQKIRMENVDTLGCRDHTGYKNIPFYISSYFYGLYINHTGIFDFDIGTSSNATLAVQVPDTSAEFYIIADNKVKNIISTYTELTGPAKLPPKWSFGLWYSTGFKGNSRANTQADALKFREEKIPCDVMHFDCYWLRDNMWCDFVWDEMQYPNYKEMLAGLKKQRYKICLWINPFITVVSDMYKQGKESGYFVNDQEGNVYTADLWHGLLPYCAIVDFTNPEACLWFQEKISKIILDGADILKTDFGEDIPYDSVFYNGMTGKEMRNVYSALYNKAVFETLEKYKGIKNTLVWARSGCAGMQRFPVCWSGDPNSSYEGMAGTLRAGLSMALSGVPFWSHDMGGFYGNVSEEVFIRWSQFGLFTSHSRLHGTTTRQPWAYGDKTLKILKKYVRLRYELMPYIWKTAHQCAEWGEPFIRPLIYENDNDPNVLTIYDQYYFGRSMIIAPVFGGNGAKRKVYLPKGEWVDWFSGTHYNGSKWYEITCPIEYMPIFRKADDDIETGEVNEFIIEE